MKASTKSSSHPQILAEQLERRTLMSAWVTDDTFPNDGGINGMAADAAGNVYAVGSDGSNNGVVREKAAGGTTWTTIAQFNGTRLYAAAADRAGNLYIAGFNGNTNAWTVWERVVGQSTFSAIDSVPVQGGGFSRADNLATDAAGDVFAVGIVQSTFKASSSAWVVRERRAGQVGFTTVDQFADSYAAKGVTVVESGASAGVYVVGRSGSNWLVRRGTAVGAGWSTVDNFRYDTVDSAPSAPMAAASDPAGNIFVVGYGAKSTITGYTKNKAPIYSRSPDHWLVRKSATGSAGSWSTNDDYLPSLTGAGTSQSSYPYAVGVSPGGNVYVAGDGGYDSVGPHAIVRTNLGGAWSNDDDFFDPTGNVEADYYAFAADPVTGALYAGGDYTDYSDPSYSSGWLVRSSPAIIPTATAPASLFSSASIATASQLPTARPVDDIFAV